MATIGKDKNGTRRILFVAPDGKRKTVRLGRGPQRVAEGVKHKIEMILAAKLAGQPLDSETAAWVGNLESTLADRLARAGLIVPPDEKPAETLGEHLAAYLSRRTKAKPATLVNLGHTQRCLIEFFGADKHHW